MPLKKSKVAPAKSRQTSKSRTTVEEPVRNHIAFFPLLTLTFIVWVTYRVLFRFPIWFDETIGKAIFFGLPVWLYISLTRSKSIVNTFVPEVMQKGLLLGVAVGGSLGFAGTLASLLKRNVIIQSAPLFASDAFWWEFFLALMTGFWESLFFFSWITIVIMERFRKWPLLNQVLLSAGIFVLFHIPNTILRFEWQMAITQGFLLFFFALGQALLFVRWRNLYSVAVSHAIWGMVLLIHTR